MLAAVEALYLTKLSALLPANVTTRAGPSLGPTTTPLVEVTASLLLPSIGSDEDPSEARSPAFLTQIVSFAADGITTDFIVPSTDEVAEVESPPGTPLRIGDEYEVSEQTIKFYRAPTANVSVLLRGAAARGFVERHPCDIPLAILIWAADIASVDALLAPALGAALDAAVDLPNLEIALPGASGARVRLIRPAASLISVQRSREKVTQGMFLRARIDLRVRGELEQSVALAAPALVPSGIILEIDRSSPQDPQILSPDST